MGLAGLEMVAQGGAYVGEGVEEGWGSDGRGYTDYGFASSVGDVLALSVFRALLTIVLCTISVRAVLGTPLLGLFNFGAFVFGVVKTVAIFRHHHRYTESRELTHAMTIACLSFAFTQVLAYFYVRAETGPAYRAYLASEAAAAGAYGPIQGESGGPVSVGVDEGDEKDKDHASIGRLAELTKPVRGMLGAGMVALLVAAVAALAIPHYMGLIISAVSRESGVSKDEAENRLNRDIAQLLIVFAVGSMATFIRGWLFTLAGQRVVASLRVDLFAAVVAQEIGFFDTNRTGELINRLSSDTAVIQNAVTVNVSMGVRTTVTILGGIALLFSISWRLALVMLSVVPAISVAAVVYGRVLKKLRKAFQDALGDAGTRAEESISQIRTVRSFNNEELETQKYADDIEISYERGASIALTYGTFIGGVTLGGELGIVLVLWYGGKLVLDGDMTAGSLTAFLLYTLTVGINLAGLAALFTQLMQAVGAADRIFYLIDRDPLLKTPEPETAVVLEDLAGAIAFDAVTFSYPSRPDVKVVEDLSLTIPPGGVTALVGMSGAGKSTLVQLIQRLYDPDQGEITIDGVPLPTLDLEWLRSRMATVSQEPVLFASSIRENIAYAKPGATLDEIVDAARKANAHDFIMGFPEQYETTVGERGVRLSGGQKQRIAIARSMLLNPQILLLDEATSAQDADSEALIQDALDTFMGDNRTVCIIAHRLSTVRAAAQVVVLDGGRIAEIGTHDELLERPDGVYRRLVERQLLSDPRSAAAGDVDAGAR